MYKVSNGEAHHHCNNLEILRSEKEVWLYKHEKHISHYELLSILINKPVALDDEEEFLEVQE